MKKHLYKISLVVCCTAFLFSCKKDISVAEDQTILTEEQSSSSSVEAVSGENLRKHNEIFYGDEVNIGNGKIRSFFTIDKHGKPEEIGYEFNNKALVNLPGGHEEVPYILPLHPLAKLLTPFKHLVADWNPMGHPPGPYLSSHFDFHFYVIPNHERLQIPAYSEASAAMFDSLPAAEYIPLNYVPTPEGEEAMGKHWVDVTSPELNGQPFTKTFIYGSYNGKVNFYEPMVTLTTLQSGVTSSIAYPQPVRFERHSFYPTKYNIYKDNSTGRHYVSLSHFVLR